ncbi:hypothetical protein AB4Z09_25735 [Rhodococcus sp. TAF43]|uniref:hypothetical protein n=1 Tax=unclassified Rhodococcus (in: high G+C Gram-positive bacteria) TaxID=192944 RepID=UPI003D255EA2
MTTTDMTGRLLELVTAARNALTPATVEQTPTDELRVLDGALDEIERLAKLHQGGEVASADGADRTIELALAEYVRGIWPAAAAVYADRDGDPTWVVDGDDLAVAVVVDLGASFATPLRELVSQMGPEQLGRYRNPSAFAFRITLPAVGTVTETAVGDIDVSEFFETPEDEAAAFEELSALFEGMEPPVASEGFADRPDAPRSTT